MALGRRRVRCVNGPNDRMFDVDGFDNRCRDVGRCQPRLRIGLVAAGGDTAGVREFNAGDDRRKNQFHNVLVHVRPPFVLTLSKEDPAGKSDKTAWNDATGMQRDIYAESKGFSRRERKGRKAHAAQSTCLRSLGIRRTSSGRNCRGSTCTPSWRPCRALPSGSSRCIAEAR